MKVKERSLDVAVQCRLCGGFTHLMVNREDWEVFESSNRPHIQDIFPYLTADERELLISNTCPDCWNKLFGGEDDE